MSNQRQLWQSQNFIKRPTLVDDLLGMTSIDSTDLVIEIGPGKGIITEKLVKRAKHVIAVEFDAQLFHHLELSSVAQKNNLSIVFADFLNWQLPKQKYKVFSNIPFNMTADIVNRITDLSNPSIDSYLIIQEAAAYRFIGFPFEMETLKSTLLKLDYEVNIITSIPSHEFTPKPKVNVVLARFRKYPNPIIPKQYYQEFRDFIVFGYTQWQPSALDSFKKIFTESQRRIIAERYELASLKPRELSLDQWLGMFTSYMTYVPSNKKELIRGSEKRLLHQQRGLLKKYRTREKK